MKTFLMMAFFYATVPTLGFFTIAWKNDTFLNTAFRTWMALLTVLGCFVVFGVILP